MCDHWHNFVLYRARRMNDLLPSRKYGTHLPRLSRWWSLDWKGLLLCCCKPRLWLGKGKREGCFHFWRRIWRHPEKWQQPASSPVTQVGGKLPHSQSPDHSAAPREQAKEVWDDSEGWLKMTDHKDINTQRYEAVQRLGHFKKLNWGWYWFSAFALGRIKTQLPKSLILWYHEAWIARQHRNCGYPSSAQVNISSRCLNSLNYWLIQVKASLPPKWWPVLSVLHRHHSLWLELPWELAHQAQCYYLFEDTVSLISNKYKGGVLLVLMRRLWRFLDCAKSKDLSWNYCCPALCIMCITCRHIMSLLAGEQMSRPSDTYAFLWCGPFWRVCLALLFQCCWLPGLWTRTPPRDSSQWQRLTAASPRAAQELRDITEITFHENPVRSATES